MKDLSNGNVIHVNKGCIQYLQFRRLLEYQNVINHAYTIGLDVNFRTDKPDRTEITKEEYKKAIISFKNICNALGSDYKHIVKPNQEHTKEVKIVDKKCNSEIPDVNLGEYDNTDGLITNKKNIILSTTNADCILLLFFDPVNKVIANVHSGWKGTLQRISVETVRKMKDEFNCNHKNIICCICPSIRKCHFEVEKDVKDLFYNEFKSLEGIDNIIEETIKGLKWHIDTVLINKIILEQEGLEPKNIIDCGICSVCNQDLIHSFRVEKQGYGLETALIELR